MKRKKTFAFIAGSLALCFVDTKGNRGGTGNERLIDQKALIAWLRQANMITGEVGSELRDSLKFELLEEARALRESIYAVGKRVIAGETPEEADIARLNRWARHVPPRPQWVGGAVEQMAEDPLRAGLSEIAADAIRLFTGPGKGRVRYCPECHMMFVDASRAGRRRWCSSAACGNRAKVRAFRARQQNQKEGSADA